MHHHEIVESCAHVLGRVRREGLDAVLGPVHPAANCLPLLDVDELAELASSIASQGYLSSFPVVVLADEEASNHRLLDGRNRLLACVALGWDGKSGAGPKPTMEILTGLSEVDAVRLVRAATTRRDLDLQTRTEALAALYALESEAAAQEGRRKGGSTPKGQGAGVERGVERTAQAVAAETGESPRTVRRRLQVQRDAVPEVRDAVRRGEIEPGPAAEVASLPAEVQVQALRDPEVRRLVLQAEQERKRTARAARKVREAQAARESAPEVPPGVDLRCVTNAVLLQDPALRGVAHLVHADPPWTYANDTGNGSAAGQYDLAAMVDIVADLDRAYDVAAEDSRLLVWVTFPHLLAFLDAIREVGLRWSYLTGGAWHKSGRPGVGYHWRGDAEVVLVFAKGSPGRVTEALSNGHSAPRGAHSEKPAAWLEEIVRAWVPEGGVVVDLYAGRAPLARACLRAERRYVGAESDPDRHVLALAALGGLESEPTTPTPDALAAEADLEAEAALGERVPTQEAPAPPVSRSQARRQAVQRGIPIELAGLPGVALDPATGDVYLAPAGVSLRDVAEARRWEGRLQELATVLEAEGWTKGAGRPIRWYPPQTPATGAGE